MDFQIVQHFYKSRIVVVYDFTVSQIKPVDFVHIFFAERKIPDIHILFHTLFMNRLWNHNNAALRIPAKSYLCGAFSVFFADGSQHRMGKNAEVSFCKRPPCFRADLIFLHERKRVLLLEERMKLYLIYGRDYLDGLA